MAGMSSEQTERLRRLVAALWRRLTFWRIAAIAAVALALGSAALQTETMRALVEPQQIARITIEGLITESRDQLRMLDKIAADDKVKALLVFVNSPGGTTTGGEALFEALRKVATKKPVVAQFGTVAASAGYIVGMGADHIVSHGNTITGSIGVIAQWPEVSGLLDKLGVKVNEIKSGTLKAVPSMYASLDEGGRQVTQGMVNEGFKWFLSLVETRRGIKTADVAGLEQGRIFSGREALAQKLIDEIGGEDQAVAWLSREKAVAKDLKVVNWKPAVPTGWGIAGLGGSIGGTLGGGLSGHSQADLAAEVARALAGATHLDAMQLDGMVSIWHP